MTMPSRAEVLETIDRLLAGGLTREDASLWAAPLHVDDSPDPVVEEALDLLTLVDAWQIDTAGNFVEYLFDLDDLDAIRELLVSRPGEEDA